MGNIETPKWYQIESPKKHMLLQSVKVSSLKEFYEEVALSIENTASSAFIFVHGYNVSFEDAAKRTAQIAYDLQFKGIPLFYSWPSEGKFESYFIDETNVKWTQAFLEQFLTEFFTKSDAKKVYLIAHSMVNRALTRAIVNVSDRVPNLNDRLKEVILAAPDIDADIFTDVIAPALTSGGYPITLYASSEDRALTASKKVHRYPRAGDTSDGVIVLTGIETIDATGVDTSLLKHSYVVGTRTILNDISYIINNNLRAVQRNGLRTKCCDAGDYWVFAQ
jgi:esterase/lipase superfamily enzyme